LRRPFLAKRVEAQAMWRITAAYPVVHLQAQLFFGGAAASLEDMFEAAQAGAPGLLLAASPLLPADARDWTFACALPDTGF
jgi:hypothetical protein